MEKNRQRLQHNFHEFSPLRRKFESDLDFVQYIYAYQNERIPNDTHGQFSQTEIIAAIVKNLVKLQYFEFSRTLISINYMY